VGSDVCTVGGDVLATEVGSSGIIARGIIFRHITKHARTEPEPPAAVSECTPICSPCFACTKGTGIPQCNPSCGDGQVCGNDRLCRASAP
jgi:hypothetical protein